MAIVPFRQLGQFGVNTDSDPFSFQDPRQWTTANNVRFRDGSIWRGPRFRKAGTIAENEPQSVIGYGLPSGGYEYLITFKSGKVFRWSQRGNTGEEGIKADLTPVSWVNHDYDEPGTWAETNSVVYFNRPDRKLWSMRKGGKGFAVVDGWGKYWRCKAVRALNGQVIAIGVQKDGRDYPTMVLNSDYTTYNTSADIWNADTTNSAASNVLADMPSALVDGWPMQDRMFLYGTRSTWVMEPSFDNFVFRYRRVFESDSGVISQNCVQDVSSTHYVFGPESIWMHNGLSRQDIVDGVIRRKIYDYIVMAEKAKFYTVYIQERNEIMFCFVSSDPECAFQVPTDPDVPAPGCNRAAVLNLKTNQWSFDDLPFVLGAAFVSAHTGKRYEEFTDADTYTSSAPHTYAYYTDRTKPSPLFVARAQVAAPPPPPPPPATSLLAVDDSRYLTISSGYTPNIIPVKDILGNDLGSNVTIVSVEAPHNGTSLAGTVTLGGDSIYYRAPPPTFSSTPSSRAYPDVFGGKYQSGADVFDWSLEVNDNYDLRIGDICIASVITNRPVTGDAFMGMNDPAWVKTITLPRDTLEISVYVLIVDQAVYDRQHGKKWILRKAGSTSNSSWMDAQFRNVRYEDVKTLDEVHFSFDAHVKAGDITESYMLGSDEPTAWFTHALLYKAAGKPSYAGGYPGAAGFPWLAYFSEGITNVPVEHIDSLTGIDADEYAYSEIRFLAKPSGYASNSATYATSDNFGYTISDGTNTSSATVHLTLIPPNDGSGSTPNPDPIILD
ncbi:hypothetical protein ACFZ8E_07460 [Methylobacterium sp. HMF5984]|uniref:hypothetical protein n=1 Tax=Methylobacterium sp. HMF5984 TaxID=3367370 RepID=UPI0038555B64